MSFWSSVTHLAVLACACGAAMLIGHGCSAPHGGTIAPEANSRSPAHYEDGTKDDSRSAARYEEATQLFEAGQHDVALQKFGLITKEDPSYWKGWYGMAVVLVKLERYEAALEPIEKAVQLAKTDANAWQVLGMVYMKLGRLNEAQKALDQSNDLGHGQLAETWYAKGAVLVSTERYQDAIDCFNRAIVIDPSHLNAWYNKGIAWNKLSDNVEALECLNEAVRIMPTHARSWEAMGLIYAKDNVYDKSVLCFEKVVALESGNKRGWYYKGAALYRIERIAEAIEALEKAAALGEARAESLLQDIRKQKQGNAL